MPPRDLDMYTILGVENGQVSTTSCFDAIIFKPYIYIYIYIFNLENLQANLI